MKHIRVKDLKPGMILAKDIMSPKGQKLAKVGDSITAQQLLHMTYYNIEEIWIQDEEDVKDKIAADEPDEFYGETQAFKISHSPEFIEFKEAYENCSGNLEKVIQDFFEYQLPLDNAVLLDDVKSVFERHNTGMGVLAMLLNMQGIDQSTYTHCVNVAIISRVFGGWLGIQSLEELDVLTMCGLFHDIGKCMIPNHILSKPERLTKEEYSRMSEHPILGYNILTTQQLDRRIKLAALQHHERGDGSGYPYGLQKSFINEFSKIVAIADVYDAMTADRCYRAGICPFEVIAEFQRQNMEKYDPKYLIVFLRNIAESYVGSEVMLSDDRKGIIVMINTNNLSSPIVKLEDNDFVDLSEHRELFIKAIL